MALPISRNTTYAGGSPIKSADLNDIQDQIVGSTLAPLVLSGMAGVPCAAGGGSGGSTITPAAVLYDVGGAGFVSSVTAVILRYHPVVAAGRNWRGVAVAMSGNGSATATIRARLKSTVIVTLTVTPPSGIGTGPRYLVPSFSAVIAAGQPAAVEIQISGAGIFVEGVELLFQA